MQIRTILALVSLLVLAACADRNGAAAAQVSTSQGGTSAGPRASAEGSGATSGAPSPAVHSLSASVPDGAAIVDRVEGDLTGRGGDDVLLVVAPRDAVATALGEGPPRTVMLLLRDATGALRTAAENARIVPCERCGGMAGDPYAYAWIDHGTLTISVAGGSRERWFDDYVFRYAAEAATWRLESVTRGVTDRQSGRRARVELTAADFGVVTFPDFDPAMLPEVVLE